MRSFKTRLAATSTIVVVAGCIWLVQTLPNSKTKPLSEPGNQSNSDRIHDVGTLGSKGDKGAGTPGVPTIGQDSFVRTVFASLGEIGDISAKHQRLIRAAARIQSIAPDRRGAEARALIQFLDTGENVALEKRFKVNHEHRLVAYPDLRTAALDWLGQLDPVAAAAYAEKIFELNNSTSDYAIALRNFAWGNPRAPGALLDYFARLATDARWSKSPDVAYLEAFDVPVHLNTADTVKVLAPFTLAENPPATRHAAAIALNRIATRNTGAIIASVNALPAEGIRSDYRADIMARADMRDELEKAEILSYLRRTDLSTEELDRFATQYPNLSGFVVPGLLTDPEQVRIRELPLIASEALIAIMEWQDSANASDLFLRRLKLMETRIVKILPRETQP
jgi:hypothetical protein